MLDQCCLMNSLWQILNLVIYNLNCGISTQETSNAMCEVHMLYWVRFMFSSNFFYNLYRPFFNNEKKDDLGDSIDQIYKVGYEF